MNLDELAKQLESDLPPFEQWQVAHCNDLPIEIKSNGDWHYAGSKIARSELVKLFARVLLCENNEYFLLTPAEKVRITVVDAPFVINQWRYEDSNQGKVLVLTDNLDRDFVVSNLHPISVKHGVPYLALHHQLEAKFSRNVFYQLAEIAIEKEGKYYLPSANELICISD